MKSFCVALGCCVLFCGAARAQPIPVAPNAPAQDVPALTDAQRTAIRALQSESEQKATQLAVQLADVVMKIYDNNLSETPNDELRASLNNQMKELVWQMLLIKGESMWAAFRLLTPEQKRIIRTEIAKPRPPGDLPDVMDLIVKTFKLTGR